MTAPVRRWTRRPQPEHPDMLVTAMFAPGEPLDGLSSVAMLADPEAAVAPAEFWTGNVAVVRYTPNGGPTVKWVIVRPGYWLAYDGRYGSLAEVSDGTLAKWYEEAGQDG